MNFGAGNLVTASLSAYVPLAHNTTTYVKMRLRLNNLVESLTNISISGLYLVIEEQSSHVTSVVSSMVSGLSFVNPNNTKMTIEVDGSSSTGVITIPEYVLSSGKVYSCYCAHYSEDESSFDSRPITSIFLPEPYLLNAYWGYDFNGCSSLVTVSLPNRLRVMPQASFKGCTNLANITIPNSVTKIEAYAFFSCSALTGLTLPSHLIEIEDIAFADSGLTSITIPNSVTKIGEWSFEDCDNLTSVTFENPNGWSYSSSSDMSSPTALSSSDLSNTATAATYLKTTYTDKYWGRS